REEDPLAGQEEAAVGRALLAPTPDPSLDLGFVVDQEPKLLVLGLELETGAEAADQRQPIGAGGFRDRVSRWRRTRTEVSTSVIPYGGLTCGRPRLVSRRSRRTDVDAPRPLALRPISQAPRQLSVSLEELPHLLVMLSGGPLQLLGKLLVHGLHRVKALGE